LTGFTAFSLPVFSPDISYLLTEDKSDISSLLIILSFSCILSPVSRLLLIDTVFQGCFDNGMQAGGFAFVRTGTQ